MVTKKSRNSECLVFGHDVTIDIQASAVRIARGKLDVHVPKGTYEQWLSHFKPDMDPVRPSQICEALCRSKREREQYDQMLADLIHDGFLVTAEREAAGINDRDWSVRVSNIQESGRLLIALTGPQGGLQMPIATFIECIGWENRPMVVLRDHTVRYYLRGVSQHLNSFSKIHRWIDGLLSSRPQPVHILGVAHGAPAAMVLGDAIGAERVTVCSLPYTDLDYAAKIEPEYNWNLESLPGRRTNSPMFELYYNSNVQQEVAVARTLQKYNNFNAVPVNAPLGTATLETLRLKQELAGVFDDS